MGVLKAAKHVRTKGTRLRDTRASATRATIWTMAELELNPAMFSSNTDGRVWMVYYIVLL